MFFFLCPRYYYNNFCLYCGRSSVNLFSFVRMFTECYAYSANWIVFEWHKTRIKEVLMTKNDTCFSCTCTDIGGVGCHMTAYQNKRRKIHIVIHLLFSLIFALSEYAIWMLPNQLHVHIMHIRLRKEKLAQLYVKSIDRIGVYKVKKSS